MALHRAAHLAGHHPETRVLLATSSQPLANALRIRLRRLLGTEPRLAEMLDAWQLNGWESYRDVARLGRKTCLFAGQRRAIWSIFERVLDGLLRSVEP